MHRILCTRGISGHCLCPALSHFSLSSLSLFSYCCSSFFPLSYLNPAVKHTLASPNWAQFWLSQFRWKPCLVFEVERFKLSHVEMQQYSTVCPGMWEKEKKNSFLYCSCCTKTCPSLIGPVLNNFKTQETTFFICIAISYSIHHLQTAVLTQSHLSVRSATPQIPIESLEESVQSVSSVFCPPVF